MEVIQDQREQDCRSICSPRGHGGIDTRAQQARVREVAGCETNTQHVCQPKTGVCCRKVDASWEARGGKAERQQGTDEGYLLGSGTRAKAAELQDGNGRQANAPRARGSYGWSSGTGCNRNGYCSREAWKNSRRNYRQASGHGCRCCGVGHQVDQKGKSKRATVSCLHSGPRQAGVQPPRGFRASQGRGRAGLSSRVPRWCSDF